MYWSTSAWLYIGVPSDLYAYADFELEDDDVDDESEEVCSASFSIVIVFVALQPLYLSFPPYVTVMVYFPSSLSSVNYPTP